MTSLLLEKDIDDDEYVEETEQNPEEGSDNTLIPNTQENFDNQEVCKRQIDEQNDSTATNPDEDYVSADKYLNDSERENGHHCKAEAIKKNNNAEAQIELCQGISNKILCEEPKATNTDKQTTQCVLNENISTEEVFVVQSVTDGGVDERKEKENDDDWDILEEDMECPCDELASATRMMGSSLFEKDLSTASHN